jgi:hypothetical protein
MHFNSVVPLFLTSLPLALAVPPPPQCTVSTINSADIVSGHVPLEKTTHGSPQAKALQKLNATAWEHWYFDGVSDSGDTGINIVFYRDATLLAEALKPLRISIDAVWSDGSRFDTTIFAESSRVETCDDGTIKGRWVGPHADCRFEFKEGSEEVKVDIKGVSYTGDQVTGSFTIKSYSKPRRASGQVVLSEEETESTSPMPMWDEGITAGAVKAEIKLAGKRFDLRGVGGSHRNVAPYSWDVLAQQWWRARAVIGPYTLVFWKFVSAVDNQTYIWSYLEENGTPVFESARECSKDEDDSECAVFTPTEGGKVHSKFQDMCTGFTLEFRHETEKWVFEVEYIEVLKESPAHDNKEYTQFVSRAKGGKIGPAVKRHEGASKSEHTLVRRNLPLP